MARNNVELTEAVIAQRSLSGVQGNASRKRSLFTRYKTILEHHIKARDQANLREDKEKIAEHSRAITLADFQVGKYAHRHADCLDGLIDVNIEYPVEKMEQLKQAAALAIRSQR